MSKNRSSISVRYDYFKYYITPNLIFFQVRNPIAGLSTISDCYGLYDRYDGHEEGLWLHCVRYTGPEWVYECPYPDWASLT